MSLLPSDSGAEFSADGRFRYLLWRVWDESKPVLNVIGCNPSKATATETDPTLTRLLAFAKSWGYGRLSLTNAFAFISTDFRGLKKEWARWQHAPLGARSDTVIGPENEMWLFLTAKQSDMVICAWGRHAEFLNRGPALELALRAELGEAKPLHCIALSQDASTPLHPLYLRGDLKPHVWRPAVVVNVHKLSNRRPT